MLRYFQKGTKSEVLQFLGVSILTINICRRLSMKKRIVSLVAAAVLLGSVSLASAGTVTTKGDTNITIGGFVETYFNWANNQQAFNYVAYPQYTAPSKAFTPTWTQFGTTAHHTRLSLGLNNPTEGIKGLVEGDFWGGGANQPSFGKGNFRLRHAYVVKEFCQEGCNYTPWLLMGQTTNPIAVPYYFSLNGPGEIADQDDGGKTPQIAFGVKSDLGNIKFNPSVYVANMATDLYFPSNANVSQRLTSPGFGINLPVDFNTGLGAPANFFANFSWQPIKLTFDTNHKDENENAWMAQAGLMLPVYFVNLAVNVRYGRGMTGSYVTYTPPSFYVDQNGSIEAIHSTGWAAQAQIDFNKLAQVPFKVAFGYSQGVFSNYKNLGYINQTNYGPIARKEMTMFANVNYNLTKSLSFGLEYDRNKTYYVGAGNNNTSSTGNDVFLVGHYNF